MYWILKENARCELEDFLGGNISHEEKDVRQLSLKGLKLIF